MKFNEGFRWNWDKKEVETIDEILSDGEAHSWK